jgi:hypothetical protein
MQPFAISTSFSLVRESPAPPSRDERRIDVDLAHVVDDDRHARRPSRLWSTWFEQRHFFPPRLLKAFKNAKNPSLFDSVFTLCRAYLKTSIFFRELSVRKIITV